MNPTRILSILAAEATNNCVNTAIFGEVCDNCNGSATMQILSYVVRAMTYGVGILAVIGIMVFGIRYLTSRGDESLAIKARRHLFQVLIGIASYIVLVLTASWILPGNLTATMLGGSPATCPEASKTEITVIEPTPQDQSNPSDPSASTPLSEGWKSGTRPRECGPGTPGDFQTMIPNGYKRFWTYTNSVGRVFAQYDQDDSQWSSLKLRDGGVSTMGGAGCCHTSYAMIAESYSSHPDFDYFPKTNGDYDLSGNTDKKGSSSCVSGDCDFTGIKKTIDSGGVVLIHACGHWGKTYSGVCRKGQSHSTHWFLLVDYRTTNGKIEYFFLNTHTGFSSFSGKGGTGWGTFGGGGVEWYSLYYRYPKMELDCKVR